MHWSLIETFIRVAEQGSMSAAAKTLHISQPTLSRQIQALEHELGFQLFVRHARGLSVTDGGQELLARARQLDGEVQQLLLRAKGLRQDPSGTVRVSASEPIAVYALPPAMARLRALQPKVLLELVLDNSPANLSRREADIAVRMFRPAQLDLVAKRVTTLELALYASPEYLERCGTPASLRDVKQHTLVGFDRDTSWLSTIKTVGLEPRDFAFRCDSMVGQLAAIRAGVGIGATHVSLARRFEDMVRVLPQVQLLLAEIWLVVHEDVRNNPAIRVVHQELEKALVAYADQQLPNAAGSAG